MNKSFFDTNFNSIVNKYGWRKIYAGCTKAYNYDDRCAMYVKAVPVAEVLKNSAKRSQKFPDISMENGLPPKPVMEYLRGEGVPLADLHSDEYLSKVYSNNSYFIKDMKSSDNSFVICADCCWVNNPSNVISYNFSFIYLGLLFSFIFFPLSDVIASLTLNTMLGRMLDYINSERYDRRSLTKYKYLNSLNKKGEPVVSVSDSLSDAERNAKYAFIDGKPTSLFLKDVDKKYKPLAVLKVVDTDEVSPLNITLLTYHGLQFLSSLKSDGSYDTDVLSSRNISEHGNGIFTIKPIRLSINSVTNSGWNYLYPINLTVRDAVNHDCIGDAVPSQLGESVRCNRADFSQTEYGKDFESSLDKYVASYPALYMNYSARRCSDVLMYMSVIWGFNKAIPITITSAACSVAKDKIAESLCCKTEADYLSKYAGAFHYKGKLQQTMKSKFNRYGCNMPLNDDCDNIQRYSAKSFRGGYNGCFSVDAHNGTTTFDLDISGAYPTSMALVPAIDWSDCISTQFPKGHKLCLDDFTVDNAITPFAPIFASITYSFPDGCAYPCLPRNNEDDDEAPAYPLREDKPVFCSGPELYLALKLGADITVSSGFKANILHDAEGDVVYPYRSMVTELVTARTEAEKKYGKKSIEAKLLKLVVNMLYGKSAQFVSKMYSSASKVDGGESDITNPASATLITSFVRAVLFAAFHDITDAGYKVYSATTDGLITDMPFDVFKKLNLFGLNRYLTESRKAITGEANPEIWSVKHEQDDLLNFTTRGNASFIAEDKMLGIKGGVFAKNGVSPAFTDAPKDCLQNRQAFIESAVSRTGRIDSKFLVYPSLKDIRNGGVYKRETQLRGISMDYDMKRKPVKDSLKAVFVTIGDKNYEVAHVETVPYADSEELKLYRSIRDTMKCLRTVAEWERFFEAVELKENGCTRLPKSSNYSWSILCNCIAGYKAGLWDIPYLNTPSLSVNEKCQWINSFNPSSEHTYGRKQWEKASEKAVQAKVLPEAAVKDMLQILQKAS